MAGQISINEAASFAERLSEAARAETLPRFRAGGAVFNKAGILFDPVTDADREAERQQRRIINAIYPHHGILGEEFGKENPDAVDRWVLDPVDGTRAFVCGIPTWTTLIAFERHKDPLVGLIDQPFMDERWIGDGEKTIYKRGDSAIEASVSQTTLLSKARLATTDPRRSAYFTSDEADTFAQLANAAQLTRFGMDAYAYGLLAIGELDLVVEAALARHDFAALVPVIANAGGVITNWAGAPAGADDRGQILAAATPALHAEAMAILKKAAV